MTRVTGDFWELLEEAIARKDATMMRKMRSGGCKNDNSYADAVGYLRALDDVREMAKEVINPGSTTKPAEPLVSGTEDEPDEEATDIDKGDE